MAAEIREQHLRKSSYPNRFHPNTSVDDLKNLRWYMISVGSSIIRN